MTKDNNSGPMAAALETPSPPSVPLLRTESGNVRACLANASAILFGCTDEVLGTVGPANPWRDLLWFDEFSQRIMYRGRLPIETPGVPPATFSKPLPWLPEYDLFVTEWLQREGCGCNQKIAAAAVQSAARRRPYHPVRDYLDGLTWDRTERLDMWAADLLGAEDTALNRAFGAKWLIAAVARVYEPGCKADCALILEGPQGALKSTALRMLAGPWFSDDMPELGSRDSAILAAGAWIIELAELDSISSAEVERIKAFMSRREDRYRVLYSDQIRHQPRQCLFAGTTNATDYLRDATGGRRWWPIKVGPIQLEALAQSRDQLWAEAAYRYKAREAWWLDDPSLASEAAEAIAERSLGDPWDDRVQSFAAGRNFVSVSEILDHLGIPIGQQDQRSQTRVGRIMVRLGWERRLKRAGTKRFWLYFAPMSPASPVSQPSLEGLVTGKQQ